MRYRWCCLVSALWIMIFSTSCSGSSSVPSDSTSAASSSFDTEKESLLALIDKLAAESNPSVEEVRAVWGESCSSSSPKVTAQWAKLIADLKLHEVPYDGIYGFQYKLSIILNGQEHTIGTMVGDYIYLPSTVQAGRMLHIENYLELADRFAALEKEIGLP